jgi:hypothetical protein
MLVNDRSADLGTLKGRAIDPLRVGAERRADFSVGSAGWPKIPVRSPAGCVGCKPSYACGVSTSPSVVRAAPEAG